MSKNESQNTNLAGLILQYFELGTDGTLTVKSYKMWIKYSLMRNQHSGTDDYKRMDLSFIALVLQIITTVFNFLYGVNEAESS